MWKVCGDIHGNINQLKEDQYRFFESTNIIVLGDFGANFFLNKSDNRFKMRADNMNITWYVVRGNHEARPQNIPTMHLTYDDEVHGEVYMEDNYPHIKYFKDFGIYTIDGYKCAVIGGAYSVDKFYRISRFMQKDGWCGWFADEQLSDEEKAKCAAMLKGQDVDFVLTHTCPIGWEPTDLFLSQINQSEVDKSTEIWLDEIKDTFSWKYWCFGHYHQDRFERPCVEMYYKDVEELDDIVYRWEQYKIDPSTLYPFAKSPNFYMD